MVCIHLVAKLIAVLKGGLSLKTKDFHKAI